MLNCNSVYHISSYDYEFPRELIAQYPKEPRDSSRLLLLSEDGKVGEDIFCNSQKYLRSGDLLVLNDTKVFPARLLGNKVSGGQIEFLLLENISPRMWKALVRSGRKLRTNTKVIFGEALEAKVIECLPDGSRIVEFSAGNDEFWHLLDKIGHLPLPHYIERADTDSDRTRYQTVYASNRGAIAAPTAGLHFTQQLLSNLFRAGVQTAFITLNVGWGTFRLIESEDIRKHKMHREFFSISAESADAINSAFGAGRRIIAVGTTTVRALESAAQNGMPIIPKSEWTELYIYPGYNFRVSNGLITNFHLPKSSLLVMVSAFAGYERIRKAYEYAIAQKFRFFSYGDAMLIWR